jgi:hypothetical protein
MTVFDTKEIELSLSYPLRIKINRQPIFIAQKYLCRDSVLKVQYL